MADANFDNFDRRLERILRQHQRLSKGYVTTVTRDGLIVAKPRRRGLPFIPWRGILAALVLAFLVKVMLFVSMGAAAYEERVAHLAAGTPVEQVGAYVLAADQATLWIANKVEEAKQ